MPATIDLRPLCLAATAVFCAFPASANAAINVGTVSSVVGEGRVLTTNALPPRMLKFQAPLSSVVDAVNVLPGVNVTPGGVFDSDVWSFGMTLRGFTQKQLGFTIDGLPNGATNYSGGTLPNRFLDPENLKRITVSQGTADISSPSDQALGGTLNYESSNPAMRRDMRIDYSTGSWNAQREFVRYDTGALFNDSTYAYMSFSNTFNKRWIGSGTNGHTRRVHVDSKVISALSDTLAVTAIASYDHAYENNYNSVTLAQFQQDPSWDHLTWNWTGKPYVDQNFVEPWNTVRTNVLVGVKLEYTPNHNSRYIFYPYYHYQKGSGGWLPPYQLYAANGSGGLTGGYPAPGAGFSKVFWHDANGDPLPPPTGCADPYDAACYPTGAVPASSFRQSLYKNNRFGFIAKGHWNIGFNRIMAGIWFQNQDRRNGRVWYSVVDPLTYWNYSRPPYYQQFSQRLQTNTRKLYAQDRIHLWRFDLSAGLSKYFVDLYGDNLIQNGARFASINSNSDLLPSVGAVFHINPNLQVYASYTKNFAPVPDTVLQTAAVGTDISHVRPETANNIDFGLRYNSHRFQASIAGYHTRFANQITFVRPASDGVTQINYTIGTAGTYVNVGGMTSKGVEALANWSVLPTLDLYASATLDDSTYLGNINGIRAGNKVAGQPGRMLVLAANYHSGGYRMGVSAKYVGDRYGTIDNSEKMPSYTAFNGYIGYRLDLGRAGTRPLKTVDLSLNVTNLFNRHYLGTLSSAGTPGYYWISPPRTVIFTASASF